MSKTLQKYLLGKILTEFFFFFALFELLAFMISSLKYSVGKGVFAPEIIISFSLYISPFMLVFAYSFSLFSLFKNIKERARFLEVFGGGIRRERRFFILLCILVFSVDLFFAFYISPASFRRIERVSASAFISPEEAYGKKIVLWNGNLLVAEKIELDREDGAIKAQNGFVFFNEKNIMKFKEIEIKPGYGYSRFSKEPDELILEEGEKGKKELVFLTSFALSSVSCFPLFMMGFLKSGVMCSPIFLGISKFARDNMTLYQSIFSLSLLHIILIFLGFYFSSKRSLY